MPEGGPALNGDLGGGLRYIDVVIDAKAGGGGKNKAVFDEITHAIVGRERRKTMKIKQQKLQSTAMTALAAAALTVAATASGAKPATFDWQVVVNNGFEIPDNPGRFYNSYNPPSVNASALVAFRARSTGRPGGPVSGIYARDMATLADITRIADRDTEVPQPNNTEYPIPGGQGATALSTFNEFPSFPRMALTADAVASRGNHQPVWTYVIGTDPDTGEDIETRAGTTGAYVNLDAKDPSSPLVTGASLLGAVPEFSDIFQVPGIDPATRFDVFPGAPAVTDAGVIAFKGNYAVADPTDPAVTVGKTGVFYRQVEDDFAGGTAAIQLTANSDTLVPNPGTCPPGTTFGSTAPPSAAGGHMVFVGFDNEDDPTCGGVYRAPLAQPPEQLTTLVGLETRVPGQGKATFNQLGEGLSYDGRLVGFWGPWGTETMTVRLYCPEEGNADRRDYCNNVFEDPDTGLIGGDPNSICDDTDDPMYPICYQEKEVPFNQGIFVYDTASPGQRLRLLARTGRGGQFDDFVYWNYSGAPPGAGESEGEAEPPRWRSSAFLAVSTADAATVIRVAFLARTGDIDPAINVYLDPVDGIYLATGPGQGPITTLIETGMDGTLLDTDAVWDDDEDPATPDVPLPVASLALERDAFRGDWLAITASMGVEEAGWAGIYLTEVPE